MGSLLKEDCRVQSELQSKLQSELQSELQALVQRQALRVTALHGLQNGIE